MSPDFMYTLRTQVPVLGTEITVFYIVLISKNKCDILISGAPGV